MSDLSWGLWARLRGRMRDSDLSNILRHIITNKTVINDQ